MTTRTTVAGILLTLATVTAPAVAKEAKPQAAPVLKIGSAAPSTDTKMKSVDGTEVSIADAKGAKGTLVVFTCNACPYAKAWEDRLVTLAGKAKELGVGVIAINANDPGKVPDDGFDGMVARAKDKKFGFPYVVDATSGVARAFGAQRTPEVFLFDAEGKLAYHGAIDDNAEDATAVKNQYLSDAMTAMAAGQAIKVNDTKSIGCSIKFRPIS